MFRIVEFPSEGAILRGRLYQSPRTSKKQAIVIMAHGFSATINGMVADKYAEVFYEAGFAVLLYDHRNFGISGGEPRQQIDRWIQARGYRDAINFVAALPEIDPDRIAIWGDSLSGGEVIVVGALDERVKAIIAQVPACGDAPPSDGNGDGFKSTRQVFLHGNAMNGVPTIVKGPLPIVSFDQINNPSLLPPLTAFRWFVEYGGRYGTNWENYATVVNSGIPASFHPLLCALHLKVPLLMVIAAHDEMPGASSEVSRMVFDLAPGFKEICEIEGGHFGLLYFPSPLFDQASRVQKDFLARHLLEKRFT